MAKGSPASVSSGEQMPPPAAKRPAPSPPMASRAGPSEESVEMDVELDPAKVSRRLAKKLREIERLELLEKRSHLLSDEQRTKVESREAVELELAALRMLHPELVDEARRGKQAESSTTTTPLAPPPMGVMAAAAVSQRTEDTMPKILPPVKPKLTRTFEQALQECTCMHMCVRTCHGHEHVHAYLHAPMHGHMHMHMLLRC